MAKKNEYYLSTELVVCGYKLSVMEFRLVYTKQYYCNSLERK